MIQYADIVYDTIVDGVGLRNTLYVSGCSHNCVGCHNKALQDYNYGKSITTKDLLDLLLINDNDLTLSGGDPMEQAEALWSLVRAFKRGNPGANVWLYSGYTYEEILQDPMKFELLNVCDVLVDGRFELDKRDITLKFRGSSNQRIIDIQRSLKENKIVELEV